MWIGLFDLEPHGDGEDWLDGAVGAWVYAAAEADDRQTFIDKVEAAAAAEHGLRVVGSEEVKKALARGIAPVGSDHRRLLSAARQSGGVAWGTFHSYDSDTE
jgi:hypothetical protein